MTEDKMFKFNNGDKVTHEALKGVGEVISQANHKTDGISYLIMFQAMDDQGGKIGGPVRTWWPEAQLKKAE